MHHFWFQVFWSYIVGMLTNLESLTIDRIHSMLRMFAMQGPSAVECSVPELKRFLDSKVRDQKLLFSGGVYRLPKSDMLWYTLYIDIFCFWVLIVY